MGAQDMDAPEEHGEVVATAAVTAPKRRLSRRLLLILLVVVVVLLIGAGVYYWHSNRTHPQTAMSKAETTQQKAYKAVQTQSAQLDRDGKYADQAKAIEDFLKTNPPKQEQGDQLHALGAAYINAGDYQKAIDTFEKMTALDTAYSLAAYHGEAMAYTQLGNKQAAIDAYKKAITIMRADKGSPHESAIAIDEAAITHLGGTP